LVGLKNESNVLELKRIVLAEKGQGYGRASIKLIKKLCFEKLGCHRLWLDVNDLNVRAKALYESEGFKLEGKLRECVKKDGKYISLFIMSILKHEYLG
jgi:diamine N-acetyltransferase